MKNILAIILILSSVVMFVSKQYNIYTKWERTVGRVVDVKPFSETEQLIKYEYSFSDLNEIKNGVLKEEKDKHKIGDDMNIVYNKDNIEISLVNVPFQVEDYLMMGVSLIGGLYLYFYSCEECECPNQIKSD